MINKAHLKKICCRSHKQGKVCGSGTRVRRRQCLIPRNKPNWAACEKRDIDLIETEDCAEIPCIGPGQWGEWGDWQKCTATCGGGETRRYRECIGGLLGTDGCPEFTSVEQENCNTERCPDTTICPDSLFDLALVIEANAAANGAAIRDFVKKLIRTGGF